MQLPVCEPGAGDQPRGGLSALFPAAGFKGVEDSPARAAVAGSGVIRLWILLVIEHSTRTT